jgi:hypothetical protein
MCLCRAAVGDPLYGHPSDLVMISGFAGSGEGCSAVR